MQETRSSKSVGCPHRLHQRKLIIGRTAAATISSTRNSLERRLMFSLKPLPGLKKYPDMMKNPTRPRYRAWMTGAGSPTSPFEAMARWSTTMKDIAIPLKMSGDFRRLLASDLSIGMCYISIDI